MRYHEIRECDIANGEGIGTALFIQGCHFHCHNCFNTETWDFDGGKEWTEEIKNKFIELANKPYIKRISLLGGECLADENLDGILDLVNEIRDRLPNKTIWIYSGYTIEECMSNKKRIDIISKCDIMIDGRYIESQRYPNLRFRGSSNQRIIDVQESIKKREIVLWESK